MLTIPQPDPLDPVNNPYHPFGLPIGSVRGFIALLIGAFFWFTLLTPSKVVDVLLAHYFMLFLVLLVFSPYSKGDRENGPRFLPRILRLIFIGGSLATLGYVAVQFPDRFAERLVPNPDEVRKWGGVYLAVTFGAFLGGQLIRFLLGRDNPAFQIFRAWMSLLGTLLLAGELIFWAMISGVENRPDIHFVQALSLGFVSAYFGSRA
jgi:hypothetical protein